MVSRILVITFVFNIVTISGWPWWRCTKKSWRSPKRGRKG